MFSLYIRECDHRGSHPDIARNASTDLANPVAEADATAAAGLPSTGLGSPTTATATVAAAATTTAAAAGRSAAGSPRCGGASPETTEQY